MKAVTVHGFKNVQVNNVSDPRIQKNDDIIVRMTSASICGSDLHVVHGLIENTPPNIVLGRESMGVIEEVGSGVTKVKKGDRVVIPFNIACTGCFTGGQAEYFRVSNGNAVPFPVPETCELEEDQLLLLSDIVPTAYWAVENAGVQSGDTVVVLGCGPLGLLVQKFVWMKEVRRVIAVDYIDYRLAHAHVYNHVETVDFTKVGDFGEYVREMTDGGADVVIDCVGMDGKKTMLEKIQVAMLLQDGTLGPVKMAVQSVKQGGKVQVVGAYGRKYRSFPLGDLYARNITLRMVEMPFIHNLERLMEMMVTNQLNPADIITHRLPLSDAKHAYEVFDSKMENCIKVILKP